MQLTPAPLSLRILIVLLMHLHSLLPLPPSPWGIYWLSRQGGFLSISLCNSPAGEETPCPDGVPAAGVGVLNSLRLLRALARQILLAGQFVFPQEHSSLSRKTSEGPGYFWGGLAERINAASGCWFRSLPWCPQCAIKHEIVHQAPSITSDHFTAAAPCLMSQRLLHSGTWEGIQPSLSPNTETVCISSGLSGPTESQHDNLAATASPCS